MKFIILFSLFSFFSTQPLEQPLSENDAIESIEQLPGHVTICVKVKGERVCIRVKVGGGKKKKKKFEDSLGDQLIGEYMESQGMLKISGFPPEINSTQLDVIAGQKIGPNFRTSGGRATVENGNFTVRLTQAR